MRYKERQAKLQNFTTALLRRADDTNICKNTIKLIGLHCLEVNWPTGHLLSLGSNDQEEDPAGATHQMGDWFTFNGSTGVLLFSAEEQNIAPSIRRNPILSFHAPPLSPDAIPHFETCPLLAAARLPQFILTLGQPREQLQNYYKDLRE